MMSSTLLAVLALVPAHVGQARPDPRVVCPAGASRVELPGSAGGRVLRCMDDTTGQATGPEVWLSVTGFYLQRGRWENGQRHGLWERWYPTGHLLSRVSYNMGQIVSSRCLTEQKRRELACTVDHHPMEWQPPAAPAAAAQPVEVAPAEGAGTADPAAPPPQTQVAPMPPEPAAGGGQPTPARLR